MLTTHHVQPAGHTGDAETSAAAPASAEDALRAHKAGRLARGEAIRLLGLRDYAELLVTLGDADLPMPLPPADG